MIKYKIKLFSRNRKSLYNFVNDFVTNIKMKNFRSKTSVRNKRKKRILITLLKSPHIYKKAQEHYGYINYSINIFHYSLETKKYLTLLKKIKNQKYPDINIEIESFFNSNSYIKKNTNTSSRNLKYYKNKTLYFKKKKLMFYQIKQKSLLKKILIKLKTLDYYGNK